METCFRTPDAVWKRAVSNMHPASNHNSGRRHGPDYDGLDRASGSFPLPWNYIYFIFVSSHQNYVDGYLYFQKGLGMPLQSRLEQEPVHPATSQIGSE